MLIDTHTHVPDLGDAESGRVDKIIFSAASSSVNDSEWSTRKVFAAAKNNPRIFCTLGTHPEHFGEEPDYEGWLADPKVVGVGEIGLDYHGGDENRAGQIAMFQKQLDIARRAKLPVAIHSRDAEADTMEILTDARGVMHCFTGSYDFARVMLDRGFYISASGIITFKNGQALRETFAKIPIDRILSETDAPFCAPVPYRGQECRPAMVAEVVKVLAMVKSVSVEEMEKALWENAHRLYDKLGAP